MAKKQVAVTLRKPPQADVDSFVASDASPVSTVNPVAGRVSQEGSRRAGLDEVILRPDGRALRELTVYLPNELAREVSLHCMENDRDVSNFLAEVLKAKLETPAPVVEADKEPVSPWEIGREIVTSLWRNRPWAT